MVCSYLFLFIFIYLFVSGDPPIIVDMKISENNMWELIVFIYHKDSGKLTQVPRLGNKELYPLRHLMFT